MLGLGWGLAPSTFLAGAAPVDHLYRLHCHDLQKPRLLATLTTSGDVLNPQFVGLGKGQNLWDSGFKSNFESLTMLRVPTHTIMSTGAAYILLSDFWEVDAVLLE